MIFRPATLADAEAWSGVVAASSPYLVQDPTSTAHEIRTEPSCTVRIVAELDGEIAGVGRLRRYAGGAPPSVLVMVRPADRGRGIGRRLLDGLLDRVGPAVRRVVAVVEDDDASRAAAAIWGFVVTRTFQKVALDPRTVLRPDPDPRVVPVADIGPQGIWELHNAVVRDDPSGLSAPVGYDEFLVDWDDPRSRPDLGRAVRIDGRPVAFTLVGAAGDRAWSDLTGTLPPHRGRGLALLVKRHALAAAARAGITRALTGNDAANAPMVAVNRRLGYELLARPVLAELSRAGTTDSGAASPRAG